jgi:hypothetical protein
MPRSPALWRDEPLLADLYSASITGRVATGPRAGRRIVRIGDEIDCEDAAMKSGNCCAAYRVPLDLHNDSNNP